MPVLKFDEKFFEMIVTFPNVIALCSTTGSFFRVYHVEVVQGDAANGPYSKYPSVVYELESDVAEKELNGRSGFRVATFNVMLFGRKTADVRALARDFEAVSQDATQATTYGFNWISVMDITDEYDIPFDYDEKAMKHVTVNVSILYPEDT